MDIVEDTGIAIIGMAGRFPGAPDVATFWSNVCSGVESITYYSDEELLANGVDIERLKSPTYVKAAAVLSDPFEFDATYFGYSPAEAELLDPQQRIFLECASEALEMAGYDSSRYDGSIGVFAGAALNVYQFPIVASLSEQLRLSTPLRALFTHSADKDFLSSRVSYKLHLTGPSMTIQSACSTSLVAVHVACQSVLCGESDMALAGAVSITSSYEKIGYDHVEGGIFSPDGHTRPFDERGKGTVFGDGAGVIVLKRLDRALQDGDSIIAVIRGSAVNNDGSDKVGYTAPSVQGQASVIAEALATANVSAEAIGYVEAHGTGTEIGDPIEIAALNKVFHNGAIARCAIGSVKSNVGHLNTASGVAGLIKVALALKDQCIPPTINFEKANPSIDFANSAFYVNTHLQKWSSGPWPRRGSVSAFGIGGTNAHVVLEEAPDSAGTSISRRWQILPISAKTASSLEAATKNLEAYLQREPNEDIANIAFTLSLGRQLHDRRRVILCSDATGATQALGAGDPSRILDAEEGASARTPVIFMFPGQGSQFVNMGKELYIQEAVFRTEFDNCVELFSSHIGNDLRGVLFPQQGGEDEAAARLLDTMLAQAAIFAVSYSLAKLIMSWGITPYGMVGHSVGEYVAATIAGVFRLEDAIAIIAERGRLMRTAPAGMMVAVHASRAEIEPFLDANIVIAAINAPDIIVLSGAPRFLMPATRLMAEKNWHFSELRTAHAFHSPAMNSSAALLTEYVRRVKLNSPMIPFGSNVTGCWIKQSEATDPCYWGRHLLEPVRFADGLNEVCGRGSVVCLEVGPGSALTWLARRNLVSRTGTVIADCLPERCEHGDPPALLKVVGQLWANHAGLDWANYFQGEKRRRLSLPTYPFERQRYSFLDKERARSAVSCAGAATLDKAFYGITWHGELREEYSQNAQECPLTTCLVFTSNGLLSRGLIVSLASWCRRIVEVSAGDEFQEVSEEKFVIAPARLQDFEALLSRLRETNRLPNLVIYMWPLMIGSALNISVRASVGCAVHGLVNLLSAVSLLKVAERTEVVVICPGTQNVLGNERVIATAALALGPCLAAAVEVERVSCSYIDVPSSGEDTEQPEELVEQISKDLRYGPRRPMTAYRGVRSWLPVVERIDLHRDTGSHTGLREGGTYLVVGGLGGLGLAIAHALAQTVRARLVLVSRSVLPPRINWDRLLADEKSDPDTLRIIEHIQNMEALGSEVLVMSADVTSYAEMDFVIERARERFGQIHGVVQAAGIAKPGLMTAKTQEEIDEILAPKVWGTMIIDRAFKPKELDFLVLFSSMSAQLPSAGRADYAAANAYLDAFARGGAKCANRTISINWDTWSEIGMAADIVRSTALQDGLGDWILSGISTLEGIEAFFRILASSYSQVLVTKRDPLGAWLPKHVTAKGYPESEGIPSGSALARHRRPLLHHTYVAPTTELEAIVAELWAELLNLETVGIEDNFFELGGHSLIALQLLPRLRSRFAVKLAARDFFQAGTVEAVARAIEEKLIAEATYNTGVE